MLKKIKKRYILKKKNKRVFPKSKKFVSFVKSLNFLKLNIKNLIVTNSHLGYENVRWNPEMKYFLWGVRNNMHVLNMQVTILTLRKAFFFVIMLIKLRKIILFSSENKYVDHILKKIILAQKQHVSCNRWIGGILSNFKEVRKNITMLTTRYLDDKRFKLLSNRRKKLKLALEGMYLLNQIPSFLIIMNGSKSKWALNESISMNIPAATILDSTSTKLSNFSIPGNNSGFSSQILFIKMFQNLLKTAKLKEILMFKKIKSIKKIYLFLNKKKKARKFARTKKKKKYIKVRGGG